MSEDPAVTIRRALGSILMCWDDTLKPSRRGEGSHVKASKEPPMPISAHILDTRAMTLSRMAGWCLVVITDRDLHTESLSGLDVKAMADLLDRHADWLRDSFEAVDVVVDELETSARELRQIVAPHRREWQSLGTCPLEVEKDGEVTPCTGTIRAYETCDPYCDGCGVEAVTSWWERAMFADPELSRLVTAPELVTFVHQQFGKRIQEATVRKWVSRGLIATAGQDDKGRTLYDKGAVAYAVARHAEKVSA